MARMTRKELIKWGIYSRHSFTVNVIINGCGNQVKKLKGLYKLAQEERVTHAQFDVYSVLIDGKMCDLKELEKYA